MSHPRRIEGYAIVSEDGMLADASGHMPAGLKIEGDQIFFEHGLDLVDVVVHGRHSREQHARSPSRRRLIVTRQVARIAADPANDKVRFWNPAGCSLAQALSALGADEPTVGVIGGTQVFELFLDRYDVFYLTRVPGVRLPDGRPVFPEVPTLTPERVLTERGYKPVQRQLLDAHRDVAVVSWRRTGNAPRDRDPKRPDLAAQDMIDTKPR